MKRVLWNTITALYRTTILSIQRDVEWLRSWAINVMFLYCMQGHSCHVLGWRSMEQPRKPIFHKRLNHKFNLSTIHCRKKSK
jgi:ABC-type antimicrobial peptide transport system ATPase subunit